MENACCNSDIKTIEYFNNKNPNILETNNLITINDSIINKINKLNSASILYSNIDDKLNVSSQQLDLILHMLMQI